MRMLALDIGDVRIGVAVSDETGTIAQPVGRIDRVGWGPDIAKIVAYAEQYGTQALLVGLPRNMDGSLGPQAEKVQAFAQKIAEKGLSVTYWDERLSTVTAERALISGNMRRERRKETVDQIAAAVILQGYLDAQGYSE